MITLSFLYQDFYGRHLMQEQHFLDAAAVEEDEAEVAGKGSDLGRPELALLHRLEVVVPELVRVSET
jgi:hypothetical protein